MKAFVFDVYGTLFDVYALKEACDKYFPGKGTQMSQIWRQKQIEYAQLRQLMGRYEPFLRITEEAFHYAVAACGETWCEEAQQHVMKAYVEVAPFEEVQEVLTALSAHSLAVFSNGSHDMLDALLHHAELTPFLDHVISVDEIQTYKPTMASYAHAHQTVQVPKEDIIFVSSNGWDVSGAKNYGFTTAWINRGKQPREELGLPPDYMFRNLRGLVEINTSSRK
ncbi:haloacid dehalogenase [Fictibacillus macauensis ZFHKF-1]|uniref:Haloacid dehalogenase n=1 Tax=Fictibacillus macauensis ZFHKF-1 TaxID=1196324 RepID=I8AE20_9BACL|nr:haloacid dehalogenase type II [Fictibacillus macauensis]EIT83837.1 haloacid dehalogenase [Fictibacillus macauensis ZFHKF-1]